MLVLCTYLALYHPARWITIGGRGKWCNTITVKPKDRPFYQPLVYISEFCTAMTASRTPCVVSTSRPRNFSRMALRTCTYAFRGTRSNLDWILLSARPILRKASPSSNFLIFAGELVK